LDHFQSLIVTEAVALVRAKGIVLPDADPIAAIKEYCAHKFHRPSMMQHLERGQVTEIDSLNGYVARESALLGLEAPFNAALTMLIKGREHKADSFD
jgi:2-dehydropantoate 2-reductase